MELINISYFQFLFISLLFIFFVLRILSNKKQTKKLPPGPWKLPLIGSIHHLITSLPHKRLAQLAEKYGPIMHLQLGELSHIVISSPETAKEVFKTHDIAFSQRPNLVAVSIVSYNYMDLAFAPYGDFWRQIRKICTVELLTAKRVDSFRPVREEQLSKLIKSIYSDSGFGVPINLSKMLSSLNFTIISRTAFGKIWHGEQTLLEAITELISATGGFSLTDLYPSVKLFELFNKTISNLKRHQQKVDKMFQNIIDENRARRAAQSNRVDGSENLIDVLLNVQEQGDLGIPLTDENIKAVIMDMFGGGTETSSTLLEWTMAELMKNPGIIKKAQEEVRRVFNKQGSIDESRIHELSYLMLVIKETLRLHPPFPLSLPRESREECSILGYEIPVKSKVIVNIWAITRDPEYWTEPDKFKPERFVNSSIDYKGNNFEFLPFGGGRRICPGMTFAITSVESTLAQLLFHFDWKLPPGITHESFDMDELFGIAVKRKNQLRLIPIPYPPKENPLNFSDN